MLAAIVAESAASLRLEVCGLLLGDGDAVTHHLPCANVADDPSSRFEIDPGALIAAYRAARGGGAAIVGCYHSHPSGRAYPSQRDAADAAPDGWWWLIAAPGEVAAWRAVSDGAVHGRFEPADIQPF